MQFTNIKHVFFDLDHTLWDFEKNASLAFERILNELNWDIPIQQFMDIYNPINVAYWKLFEKNEITHEELRFNRISDTLKKIEINFTSNDIHLISKLFIDYLTDNNYLIEGTLEVLEYLKPKYKLHIITNGFARVQEIKLERSQINSYFSTITNSEMAGFKKPHPTIFEYALRQAGATPNEVIMIGDSWGADVVGAQSVGIIPIYFEPNLKPLLPIVHVKKLNQLLTIL